MLHCFVKYNFCYSHVCIHDRESWIHTCEWQKVKWNLAQVEWTSHVVTLYPFQLWVMHCEESVKRPTTTMCFLCHHYVNMRNVLPRRQFWLCVLGYCLLDDTSCLIFLWSLEIHGSIKVLVLQNYSKFSFRKFTTNSSKHTPPSTTKTWYIASPTTL